MRAGLIAILLVGCHDPITQVVLVVDSDLDPAMRATIAVEIDPASSQGFQTAAAPPFSFGVRARDDAESVALTVEARDASGGATVRRRAVVPFTQHETTRAVLRLEDSCRFVWATCAEGRTCRDGACTDVGVEPTTPITPGEELSDAGP